MQLLTLPYFEDERGSFAKLFQANIPELADFQPRQINAVHNPHRATWRGLHYQQAPHQEAKFFRVLQGSIQLVALHLPTRQVAQAILAQPATGALVPRGWATGYLVLEDHTWVVYASDRDYIAGTEGGIGYYDPLLTGLPWALPQPWRVSEKDQQWAFM